MMNSKSKEKIGRETDEKDSTTSVWWNYFLATAVIVGLIVLDILTEKGILNGSLIGMIVMKALDGLTKMNDYFFPGRSKSAPDANGGTPANGQNK